jgi:hypothetical protein
MTDRFFELNPVIDKADAPPVVVECGHCGQPLMTNPKGDIFTGPTNPTWLCDACGEQLAPELMPLLKRLRALEGPFTLAHGAKDLEVDADAWTCPACKADTMEEQDHNWHVVDAAGGNRLCNRCAPYSGEEVIRLRDALNRRERFREILDDAPDQIH